MKRILVLVGCMLLLKTVPRELQCFVFTGVRICCSAQNREEPALTCRWL